MWYLSFSAFLYLVNGSTRPPYLPPDTCTQVKKQQLELDWFQNGKGVPWGCILLPWLFNLQAEYIGQKTGLDEAQAGIKVAGRNINNIRYADDTTLMAESEELKSLLM